MTTAATRTRWAVGATVAAVFSALMVVAPPDLPAAAGVVAPRCDFDRDGFGDLAVGVPRADVGAGAVDGGAVHVLFGTANGILAKRDRLWTQNSPGMLDAAEGDTAAPFDLGDRLGSAVACGDYDGDGYSDLVVGIPGEDVAAVTDAGAVAAIRGGPQGPTATGNQFLHQALAAVAGEARSGDEFGGALAMADFDNDGYDDLAVGIIGEDADVGATASGKLFTGAVQIFPGGPSGLSLSDRIFTRDSPGIRGDSAFGDAFGASLTAGDYNGDGFADLAVGVPYADPGGRMSGGEVTVLYGSARGLRARNEQRWHLGSPGIRGGVAAGDVYGRALASGDLDGDGFDDLAVGAPGKTVNGNPAAGMVSVMFGGPAGLTDRNVLLHQNSPGIRGVAEEGDRFGWALAIDDFDGDGFGDLAVGVPDDLDGTVTAGAVNIIYGSADGLTLRNDRWRQGLRGVRGEAAPLDAFGERLLASDFDADGFADLAVGIPEKDVEGVADAGAVTLLYGRRGRLLAIGDRMFSRTSPGILGEANAGDGFGVVR